MSMNKTHTTVLKLKEIYTSFNSSGLVYNGNNKTEDKFIQTSSLYPPVAPDILRDDSLRFILVPLAVLFGIIALSALVYLMARNRRRFVHISWMYRRSPDIIFDDSDTDMENLVDDDYDGLNDPTESLLNGKLQIDNRASYGNYQTTQVTINGFGKSDLFT